MEKTINKCITLTQDWSVDFACLKGSPQPGTATFQWNIQQPQHQDKKDRKKLPWYINQTAHQFQPFACRNEAVSAYFQTDRKPDNSRSEQGWVVTLVILERNGRDSYKRHYYVPYSKFTCTDEIRCSSVLFVFAIDKQNAPYEVPLPQNEKNHPSFTNPAEYVRVEL